MASEINSLQAAILHFSNPDNCLKYLVARRWPNGVVCPTCGSREVSFLPSRRVWQCRTRHPKSQFSVKVGTIFEDSPISLDKWLIAMWMVANCRNGASSYEISRDLGVTQKTAWFMLHRIRLAMQDASTEKLSGEVEVDETYVGGKARNMHKSRKDRLLQGKGGGSTGKTGVQGMLARGGRVRVAVIEDSQQPSLHGNIQKHVEPGSELFTDEAPAYSGLQADYFHRPVNHVRTYVDGNAHTNTLENFWSLLKRGIKGTYVSVEPFHLFRYAEEQAFRYNVREQPDSERLGILAGMVLGKRLTYAEVTGKVGETRPN
jgi:transposase-like protein